VNKTLKALDADATPCTRNMAFYTIRSERFALGKHHELFPASADQTLISFIFNSLPGMRACESQGIEHAIKFRGG
jgi:hypothetical protein